MVLVRHHHNPTVTQVLLILVLLALAKPENRLDGGELLVLVELLLLDVLDVEELTTKRKHAVPLTAYHIQAANGGGGG